MRRFAYLVVLAVVTAAVFSSCYTDRKALQAASSVEVSAEEQGLAITLRFRDEASLNRQFGADVNPFLTNYYRFMFRRVIVFELTLKNIESAPYKFQLARCQLSYAGQTVRPTNAIQLLADWESADHKPRITQQREPIINRYVLPYRKTVATGGRLFGFLVFKANLPNHGEAQVSIPGSGGPDAPPLTFSYTF